jgi:hypothetical protein
MKAGFAEADLKAAAVAALGMIERSSATRETAAKDG